MSPSTVIIRWVKPAPGPELEVCNIFELSRRSVALVVATAGVLLVALLPVPTEVTSTGLFGSAPLYSTIRTSG